MHARTASKDPGQKTVYFKWSNGRNYTDKTNYEAFVELGCQASRESKETHWLAPVRGCCYLSGWRPKGGLCKSPELRGGAVW
jgi:hypothetical protein